MTFVSIEYSIKVKLAKVPLSCLSQSDDKSCLHFVYTVTASNSKPCWILIIHVVEQPITGFYSISGNLKVKSKKQTLLGKCRPFSDQFWTKS